MLIHANNNGSGLVRHASNMLIHVSNIANFYYSNNPSKMLQTC